MEKIYSLSLKQVKAYVFSAVFVAGNLLLPFVIHNLPPMYAGVNNGLVWLPIYFFTLIAAYKFGVQVGLLTAVFSPLINCLLFGMPMPEMLFGILAKSILLAVAAAFFAKKTGKVSLLAILFSVLSYQITGTVIEWLAIDFLHAIADFKYGFWGMLLQLFGGYFVLKALAKV
ncbi:MAG: ECF transporter S component [Prevotellaceae bacterium]|jgi:hypothetical protein|nr:ECF transporter S component [Prevotellaceae bacterium]